MRWKRLALVLVFTLVVYFLVMYLLFSWLRTSSWEFGWISWIFIFAGALPFFAMSIILVVGSLAHYRERSVCPYCGTENESDALDCKKCGMIISKD